MWIECTVIVYSIILANDIGSQGFRIKVYEMHLLHIEIESNITKSMQFILKDDTN